MAKTEFLRDVRRARNLFVHRVDADSSTVDTDAISRTLAGAVLWLTPSVVSAFETSDFSEMPESKRVELEDSVNRFRNVASEFPADGPASPDQIKAGTAAFGKLVELLKDYIALDRESEQIRRIVNGNTFPESVITWEFEFGEDSTGDSLLWLWIVVDDSAAHNDHFFEVASKIRRDIVRSLREHRVERWPLVRFRTVTEERELVWDASEAELS